MPHALAPLLFRGAASSLTFKPLKAFQPQANKWSTFLLPSFFSTQEKVTGRRVINFGPHRPGPPNTGLLPSPTNPDSPGTQARAQSGTAPQPQVAATPSGRAAPRLRRLRRLRRSQLRPPRFPVPGAGRPAAQPSPRRLPPGTSLPRSPGPAPRDQSPPRLPARVERLGACPRGRAPLPAAHTAAPAALRGADAAGARRKESLWGKSKQTRGGPGRCQAFTCPRIPAAPTSPGQVLKRGASPSPREGDHRNRVANAGRGGLAFQPRGRLSVPGRRGSQVTPQAAGRASWGWGPGRGQRRARVFRGASGPPPLPHAGTL